jgi:hypothetical protein
MSSFKKFQDYKISIMNKILNPFKYIAGWESLAAGIVVLFATAGIGYFSHIHFPDLISVKTNPGLPFYILIIQGFSNWLVMSILLYLAAVIFSPSSVRGIDIFGTQAMARFPYILAALSGFSGLLDKFGRYLMWSALNSGEPVKISSVELIIAVMLLMVTMVLTIWMIVLMFNAFKISANLKGVKLIVSFIVAVIASTIITGMISTYFIKSIMTPL